MQKGDTEMDDGFSSNEQFQEEEPVSALRNEKINENHPFSSDLIITKIEPPAEIKKKHYSLEPDIVTGWAPKMFMPKPVKLIFENAPLQQTIKLALASNGRHKLCYLGPRFNSTYSAWKVLKVPFPYNYLNEQKIVLTDRVFVGMNPRVEQSSLRFDSIFESGNLDAVFRVQQKEYNCFMRVDANTKGHLQWYYFKVYNLSPNQKYRINIYNFQKSKTLYTRGMKPYIFSAKEFELKRVGWQQGGEEITYNKNILMEQSNQIYDKQGRFFKLSFLISTEHQNDALQIAYCPPYTFSRLSEFLTNLNEKCRNKKIITEDHLCITLGGFKLPLLTITNEAEEEQQLFKKGTKWKGKKLIFVMGRVHPGECNGSFMMEGFLKWLCNNSQQSNQVRQRFIFKILPMANPDGVIIGNYRAGLSGKDFNREFIEPDPELFVEVYELKKFIQKCKAIYGSDFNIFMDFHGHTVKKNVFTYGPQFSITDHRYYESRLLPKLVGRRTPLFRYHSCAFKITPNKEATARAVLLKELKISFAYTVEASNGSYYSHEEMKDIAFTEDAWLQVGEKIAQSVFDYWLLFKVLIRKKQERARQKQLAKIKKDKNKRIQSSVIRPHHRNSSAVSQRYKSSLSNLKAKEANNEQIFNQIYQQLNGELNKEDKCSDDQLSEGRSDSESEDNDLQPKLIEDILQTNLIQQKALQPERKSYIRTLKVLKRSSMGQQLFEGNEKCGRMFEIARQRIKIRKKIQSIGGTPSPVKEAQNNTAKIVNISFILNPISILGPLQQQRPKKMKTQISQIRTESRKIPKQQQFDSYRKTYLSLQRQTMIKKQDLKRRSMMNNTFNGPKLKIDQIVGRRIFTQTNL